jgi:NADH-quinone oxidoreductase subunit L
MFLFIIIPFLGFLVSLLFSNKQENAIANTAIATIGLHLLGFFGFAIYWLMGSQTPLSETALSIFQTDEFNFSILFYFDKISLVYMAVGSVLTFLVSIFSRTYLHRDPGFKRLFNSILLFYVGLNFIVFSGNFETIFVGWEMLGITSFLLIAFYRDRFLPIKNALKVVSVYRLSDICMLIAIWLCHHLLHENVTFIEMTNAEWVTKTLGEHHTGGIAVCLLFLVAAAIKSAQFPFSSWLPRAMEGPTSSSAIFYGSLSVHIGVFLLLRTFPFWDNFLGVKICIFALGLLTALFASGIADVQPTVKTQIGYASVAQIGIMFMEIALGFHTLALLHFTGNAFLRTYQLLVSPSVLGYMIHEQFYHFEAKPIKVDSAFMQKIRYSLYIMRVKEWNLDFIQFRYMWSPFKWLGRNLEFLNNKIFIFVLGAFYLAGIVYLFEEGRNDESMIYKILTISYAIIGLVLILKAFAERGDALRAWSMIAVSQLFIALTIALNDDIAPVQIAIFLSGTLASAILGWFVLYNITKIETGTSLNNYHGHVYEHPRYAFFFLVACLGLAGFPFTPTFLGIDLMFSHIETQQYGLIAITAVTFIFLELSLLRLYARIFLGQHVKNYHEIAYKSS